jgi:hypothetical protein
MIQKFIFKYLTVITFHKDLYKTISKTREKRKEIQSTEHKEYISNKISNVKLF